MQERLAEQGEPSAGSSLPRVPSRRQPGVQERAVTSQLGLDVRPSRLRPARPPLPGTQRLPWASRQHARCCCAGLGGGAATCCPALLLVGMRAVWKRVLHLPRSDLLVLDRQGASHRALQRSDYVADNSEIACCADGACPCPQQPVAPRSACDVLPPTGWQASAEGVQQAGSVHITATFTAHLSVQLGEAGLPACSLASSQTGAVAAAAPQEQPGTSPAGSRPSPEAGSGTSQRLKPDAGHQAEPAARDVPHKAAGSPRPVRHDSAASLVLDTAQGHRGSRLSAALPGVVPRKLATCSRDGCDTGSQALHNCCRDQQQAQEVDAPAAAGAATGTAASSSSQVMQQRPAGTASIPRLHLTPPRASPPSDPSSCAASPEQAAAREQRHTDASLNGSMHVQGRGLPVPEACRVWVVQWLDYTSKYGMGYLLSSGACGVLFNDRSRLLLAPDAQTLTYVQRSSHGGSFRRQD